MKGPKHLWVDRDDSVLIVDSENDVVRRYLRGLFDIAREVDHAAQRELARQRAELHREARARKPGHEQLSDLVAKVDGRHAARTWRDPSVSPL